MKASPWVEIKGTAYKTRLSKGKNGRSEFTSFTKRSIRKFHTSSGEGKESTKNCDVRAELFCSLNLLFLTFSLSPPPWHLKLLNDGEDDDDDDDDSGGDNDDDDDLDKQKPNIRIKIKIKIKKYQNAYY